MGASNKLEIHKYKIEGDDRYHNVPKHFTTEFEELVGEQGEHITKYTYKATEEDYTSRQNDEENFYHPLEGLDYKELENVLDKVDIQKYKVSYENKFSWITHCPVDGIKKFEKHCKDYQLEYESLEKYPTTQKQYQDFCNNHPPDETPIPIGQYDDLAHEFSQIIETKIKNKEELIMTSNTSTAPTYAGDYAPTSTVPTGELMNYLSSCTRAFLDELILTFNNEQALDIYQYAHSTKKKQDAMYKIITKDLANNMKQYQAIENFHNYVQKSADSVKEAQATMKSYREGLRAKVNDIDNTFEITKETRDYQDQIKGQIECCKLIEAGLKGLGKAVVAGHIIGKEEQVKASANYVMAETSKVSKVQNLDDKSLKGIKTVIKSVKPSMNRTIASLHNDKGELNALADKLAAETQTQRDTIANKVDEVVKQGVGS